MKKVFLLLVLIPVISSFAQWNKIPQTTKHDIYTVYLSGNEIFAGTDSLIFISTDKGQSWTSGAISNERLISITDIIKVKDAVYTGTVGNGVFRSLDNGKSWQQFNSGLGSFAQDIVCFQISGDTLFLGTGGGGVYLLTPGSSSVWQPYSDGLPSRYAWTINAMTQSGSNLIAGVGASGFYYLRPKNSNEWIEKEIDLLKRPNVNALAAKGDTVFAATPFGIYRSADKGNSWDSVGISAMDISVTHLAIDDNRVYAAYNRGNDFFIWYSEDMGKTWKSQDHQFASLYDFAVYDSKFWAATNSGLWYYKLQTSDVLKGRPVSGFSLEQNYPNPFNPSTTISFSLPNESHVKLSVLDLLGREVKILLNGRTDRGMHRIKFDASELSSGIFFYILSSDGLTEIKKMVVVK